MRTDDKVAQLAVGTAVGKELKARLDDLRRDVTDAMLEAYEKTGADRIRAIVNGKPVGTVTARVTRPVGGMRVRVADRQEYMRWLFDGDGRDYIERLASAHEVELLDGMEADGVLPPGCVMERHVEPARFVGVTVRVDAKKVGEALGDGLDAYVAGLIGDGQ